MYLIYLYRVIHFYITLRRLGWFGLGWDHVSFGGCPSMYLPVSRSTVDRHIGHYVGRESTEYRPSAGRELVEYWSRACRVSTDMLATRGRFSRSVDSLSIVDRYFADGSCAFTGDSFLRRIPQELISTAISTSMQSLLSEILMCFLKWEWELLHQEGN